MYIGKHKPHGSEDARDGERPMHLPENYAGNTFREVTEALTETDDTDEGNENYFLPTVSQPMKKTEPNELLPRFDKLFSSDTLLILLAILLWGCEDGYELSLLLLALLLF